MSTYCACPSCGFRPDHAVAAGGASTAAAARPASGHAQSVSANIARDKSSEDERANAGRVINAIGQAELENDGEWVGVSPPAAPKVGRQRRQPQPQPAPYYLANVVTCGTWRVPNLNIQLPPPLPIPAYSSGGGQVKCQ